MRLTTRLPTLLFAAALCVAGVARPALAAPPALTAEEFKLWKDYVAALEDVLARVSVLADDLPEVRSLELHPVVVAERGAAVLRARVELAPAGRAAGASRGR